MGVRIFCSVVSSFSFLTVPKHSLAVLACPCGTKKVTPLVLPSNSIFFSRAVNLLASIQRLPVAISGAELNCRLSLILPLKFSAS